MSALSHGLPTCHFLAPIRKMARRTSAVARNTDQMPLTILYATGASWGSLNSSFSPFTAAWRKRSAMRVPKVSPEKRVNALMYSDALAKARTKCMSAVKMRTQVQKGLKSSGPRSLCPSAYLNM